MTERENFIRVIKRQNPSHVPFYFEFCPSLYEKFKQKTGQTDYNEYYQFPIRYLTLPPTRLEHDFTKYFDKLAPGVFFDEWGVGYEPRDFEHFTIFLHAMENFTTPEEVMAFPLPDLLADYRWEELERQIRQLHDRGLAVAFSNIMVFETSWYLRGLDNLLTDMMIDEEMAAACLYRVRDLLIKVAEKAAKAGVDVILMGDDVGTQRGMMMSTDLWRKWILPAEKMVIQAAKAVNPDVFIFFHTDGKIYDVIDDLVEIGVDILNPVQPECVDPLLIKQKYGDKLAFWGTIGIQTTMPFGSVDDVKRTVKEMIEGVGYDGGLVIAPTHMLEPEVPYENIEAFLEAVKEYGKY